MRTIQSLRTNSVMFCSSHTYCELAIESTDNLYIMRYWKNGDRELAHNCYKVKEFPKSILVTRLLVAAGNAEPDILEFLGETDIARRNALWWKIKDTVEQV